MNMFIVICYKKDWFVSDYLDKQRRNQHDICYDESKIDT